MIQHETVINMFNDLGIDAEHNSPALESLVAADSKYIRDLKLNVGTVLNSKNLVPKEAYLLALSVVANERHAVLIKSFEKLAQNAGATDAEIAETHGCASLMSANNIFYRFKHYMEGVEYYGNTPAGLRMSIMMNPAVGKEFFELMSLTVSAVNGCERCVTSHERSVKEHGATEARIYDAIRLGAIIKSLCVVI